MITNKELQDKLKQYPSDLPVGLAVSFNDNISAFYDVKVDGIQQGDLKIVLIHCPDLDSEYEHLINGEGVMI